MSQVIEPGPGTFVVVEDGDKVELLKRDERGWLSWTGVHFFPFPMPWASVDTSTVRLATITDLMKVGHPVTF